MSKETQFYEKDYIDLKTKFYRYMDTLVTHNTPSRAECTILIVIFYSQLISGFFTEQIELLKQNQIPDSYLMQLQTIIRIRDLFKSSFKVYEIIMYLLFIILVTLTIIFVVRLRQTEKSIFYSYCEVILNFSIKIFIYVLFQPILDFCLSLICFTDKNPNFEGDVSCSLASKIPLLIIMLIIFFYTIFLGVFFSIYYNENFMLTNNCLARVSTKYELYTVVNMVVFSIILTYSYNLGPLIFTIYNFIISIVLLRFYLEVRPHYDYLTSFIICFFHILYTWTALFGLLFYFLKVEQVSIVWLFIAVMILWMSYNLHSTLDENITLCTPFHKIKNRHNILLYIKNLITKMNTIETNPQDKAEIIGIVHLHKIECPLIECPSKIEKKKFYLPLTDEWSKPDKLEINDRVYLNNFVTFVYDFYVSQNLYTSDVLMNLSIYYLQIIGNHCGAMYYCQRAGNEKLTLEEKFMHFRTSELISKALVKSFRPSNEIASDLEEVNTSMYFKYQDLSEKFFCEISSDISLSTEFWKLFITPDLKRKKLDFNRIFTLTDRIRITKQKIEEVWKELFETYNGCNELFDLYECYVEYINDDDLLLRELLAIRNKNFTLEGVFNYYNILFNQDTGIIIASGDKGKEGMIERVSENLAKIFQFSEEEIKGMNVGFLMPRMFEKDHRRFMQRCINVGEKRVVDKALRTFAKDKYNNLLVLNIYLKLFPILSDSTYFCAMITKESLDDVILLDQEYNIQGMSDKLYTLFKLNQNIFQDCDVPFWMVCKEFIHHYQTFMANNPLIKYSYAKKNEGSLSKSIVKSGISTTEESTQPIVSQKSLMNNSNTNNNNHTELEFEINENADVQWEIAIPPIFKLYTAEENKQQNFISMTIGINRDESDHMSSDVIMENSKEDEDNYTDETGKMLNNLNSSTDGSKSMTQSYGGQDHDKEFQNTIHRYRTYFTNNSNNNINELIGILSKLNQGNDQTFKFVISFKQIRYGEGKFGYVIRCIDNKNDVDLDSEERVTPKSDEKDKNKFNLDKRDLGKDVGDAHQNVFDRRKYLAGLKAMEQVTKEDMSIMRTKLDNFHKLVFEDEEIKNNVDNYHQEILLLSRVLGANAAAVLDENGSQSSSTSQYTNSITKKTRVQEIKSNLMISVKNFYTLRLIKVLYIFFMIVSVIFAIIYILQFDSYISTTDIINKVHTSMLGIMFCYIEVISSVASMKGLSQIINYYNDDITFLPFTRNGVEITDANKEEIYQNYSNTQKILTNHLYASLVELTSRIELNYTREISNKNSGNLIWGMVQEGFVFNNEINDIGLMMSISQTLSYVNELLNKTEIHFPLSYQDDPEKDELDKRTKYLLYKAIENTYVSDVPAFLQIIYQISDICSDENNVNYKTILYLLVGYIVVCCLFAMLYSLLLFLTNRNMEDGLVVISRIDPVLIDETLKSIDTFNKTILSKFRSKGERDQPLQKSSKNYTETGFSTVSAKSKEEEEKDDNAEEEANGFYDQQVHKGLKILSFSYFQSLLLVIIFLCFILPIYFQSWGVVKNTNNFFHTKQYLYNDLIDTSLNILNIKIKITNSDIKEAITYNFTTQKTKKKTITDQINKYPAVSSFYTDKFINSVCMVLYTKESTQYNTCINDQIISEYCSVNDMYSLIQDNIYSINRDFDMKKLSEGDNFNPLKEFETQNFENLEYLHNNYFVKIPEKIIEVFEAGMIKFMEDQKSVMTIILVFMIIAIWIFSLYIMLIFMQSLINLLLISRCIFKIIPTKVINKTKELEDWIDDKY